MTGAHGPVRVGGIREVDISHGSVARTVLASLVSATVDRVSTKDGVRCPLSGGVETLVICGQPRRLLSFVNSSPVRIDGTDSLMLLWLCRFWDAAITSQAMMDESATLGFSSSIVQLDPFPAKRADTFDRNGRAVTNPLRPLRKPRSVQARPRGLITFPRSCINASKIKGR
jgi:hypothetical protein